VIFLSLDAQLQKGEKFKETRVKKKKGKKRRAR